jgi:RNA polymerase sigma factor (sigma-70 family)
MQRVHAGAAALLLALVLATTTTTSHAFVPPAATKASNKPSSSSSAAATAAVVAPKAAGPSSPLAAAGMLEAPSAATAVRPRRRRRQQPEQQQQQQQQQQPEQQLAERQAEQGSHEQEAAAAAAAAAVLTPEERQTRARVRSLQRAAVAVARQRELAKALGRSPTEGEWAGSLQLSPEALRAALEQGARAREALAQGWKGLVHKLVARHATFLPASELEDLADEGFAGLMEAALRFKPGDAAFSTYAFYWVRKRVLAAVAARDRTTFQSAGEQALAGKVQAAMQAAYETTGRWPSWAEAAGAVGITEARVGELLRRGRRYQLLEASSSGYVRFADTLSDPEAPDADSALEALYLAEVEAGVASALGQLPEEERTVLALRLGLRDGQPKSWEELGRIMDGCSVSYLRKVEARAKTHLRRNVEVVKLLHRRPPSLFGDEAAAALLAVV